MTRNRETYPNSTSYIEIANSLGTDKNQIGLRVQKINIRVHNQQATGCCLGAHSLRDEVIVRELNEASDHLLPYLSKSGQGLPTKGGGETKTKKGESKYQSVSPRSKGSIKRACHEE